jgi:UDP-N-acetylmuramyl tripeptide synthase
MIEEILVGRRDVEHEVDRRGAIEHAIAGGAAGDILVIVGKDHEQGQEFTGGRKFRSTTSRSRDVLRAGRGAPTLPSD